MPAPTDILNDDIKELRQSNREILSAIAISHKELAGAISDLRKEHTGAISDLRVEMTRRFEHMETRLDTYVGISKWVAGIITALVVAVLGSIGAAIWWASNLDTRVRQVEHRIEAVSAQKK